MSLEKALESISNDKVISKPIIFDLSHKSDQNKVEKLLSEKRIQHVSDDFEEQHLELFGVKNPSQVYTLTYKEEFSKYFESLKKEAPPWQHGKWVYFPWNSTLVHILPEEDFWLVRTNRNRNLINLEEQKNFYNATVGIGGLSVGSNIAYALVLQGGPKRMKLADMDKLALSNTNRILSGAENLGILKVDMASRLIYQINPYAEVETFPEGLQENNIDKFFDGLDIMIDELDSFPIKYLIREQCKKHGIALLQAADNGDNGVVDIERYDIDPNTPFFHGRLGEVTLEMFKNLDKFGIGKTITQLVGPENVTERMQGSLLETGKTIVSWPQLGGAALLNGAAVAYGVRKVLNNQPLESNRSLVNMDSMLDPTYHNSDQVSRRAEITENFRKMFGL
ncbi:ThiF family adenylyltransferase [Candidatus Parcubacteria bacterium]|nr:ThiF family adenylyltransferase [Candidatus Parcubacteria bacterium]